MKVNKIYILVLSLVFTGIAGVKAAVLVCRS